MYNICYRMTGQQAAEAEFNRCGFSGWPFWAVMGSFWPSLGRFWPFLAVRL